MSKIIATSVIAGAHQFVNEAEEALQQAIDTAGPEAAIELPNTGYYLPVIYGLTGIRVEKIKDMEQVLAHARELLPEGPAERLWTPYLGTALDAGVAHAVLLRDHRVAALHPGARFLHRDRRSHGRQPLAGRR